MDGLAELFCSDENKLFVISNRQQKVTTELPVTSVVDRRNSSGLHVSVCVFVCSFVCVCKHACDHACVFVYICICVCVCFPYI